MRSPLSARAAALTGLGVGQLAPLGGPVRRPFGARQDALFKNTRPAPGASLDLDFVNNRGYAFGQGQRAATELISFSRASTAGRTNELGLLEQVAANVPRIDHDQLTGVCKGLLIEEARTNLLTYSAQFDSAAWGKSAASITANGAVAPDGTTSADKFVEDTTTAAHRVNFASATITSGVQYSASVYVKAAERSYLHFRVYRGATNQDAVFNLTTGSVVSGTASITPVGGGWYRVWQTFTADASITSQYIVQLLLHDGTTSSYAGDGYSGIYIWGAQLEAGAFPTSYIPTTSAAVTRPADVAQMTGTNFSRWYRQDEGTMVVRAASFAGTDIDNTAATLVKDPANFISIISNISSAYRVSTNVYAASSAQFSGGSSPINSYYQDGSFYLAAVAYKVNDLAFASNLGATLVTDSTATLPECVVLNIGSYYVTSNRILNGHIDRLTYYPARLSNAELQALTA